jgi:DNA-binding NarL/FixJ family response regulator
VGACCFGTAGGCGPGPRRRLRGAAADGTGSFDALAVPRLAESAWQELRASGETRRRRIPEAWDQLTPQGQQIVRLVAAGFSNREIGQQFYMTHRTVG